MRNFLKVATALALASIAIAASPARAQALAGPQLVEALRQGGYVLLMRHASSPRQPPSAESANSDNPERERQLDESGRAMAQSMGDAFRALGIPVGEVLSSPTYRALETVKYARFGEARKVPELGDGGQSMQPVKAEAGWLRTKIAERPRGATNTIIITHVPNIVAALADAGANMQDSETLVIRPEGSTVVARVKGSEWMSLSAGK